MNQKFDDFDRPHPQQPEDDPFDTFFTDETLRAIVQALPVAPSDTADDRLRRNAAAMHLLRSLDAGHPVEAALATQAVLCPLLVHRRLPPRHGLPASRHHGQ